MLAALALTLLALVSCGGSASRRECVPILDWRALSAVAVVRDEPYWRCDAEWCDQHSACADVTVSVPLVSASLDKMIADAHAAGKLAWINYSEPELRWLSYGAIPTHHLADVVSFDRYAGVKGWDTTADWAEVLRKKLAPGQRMALVVEHDAEVVKRASAYACDHHEVVFVVRWP